MTGQGGSGTCRLPPPLSQCFAQVAEGQADRARRSLRRTSSASSGSSESSSPRKKKTNGSPASRNSALNRSRSAPGRSMPAPAAAMAAMDRVTYPCKPSTVSPPASAAQAERTSRTSWRSLADAALDAARRLSRPSWSSSTSRRWSSASARSARLNLSCVASVRMFEVYQTGVRSASSSLTSEDSLI